MSKTSKPKEGDAPKVEVADTGGNREEKDGLSAGECAGSDVERESGEQELDKEKLIAGLKEENEKLKKELDEIRNIYQRVLAEYANYKRAQNRKRADWRFCQVRNHRLCSLR